MIPRIFINLVLILSIQSAWAFKLSPMNVTFNPSEKINTKLFSVKNDSNEKIAVQITMAKRLMDEVGKEKHPEVEDEFLVYPDQMILGAKESRTIKVTWLSKKAPKVEKAYRIIAEQLPIDVARDKGKKRTNIKILLRYIGAVYVTPKSGASNVKIEETYFSKTEQKLFVRLHNSGNMHKILRPITLTVAQGGQSWAYQSDKELKGLYSENILAQSKRNFLIDWPKGPDSKQKFTVELDFDK